MAKLITTPANATRAESLVQKMKPDLQHVFETMLDLLNKADTQMIDSHYGIGELVEAVKKEVNKYGNRAVETLAKALVLDDSTLYRCGAVVQRWTKKEFDELQKRRDAVYGRSLSWSHILVISEVESDRIRDELLEAVLAEGLPVSKTKDKRYALLHPSQTTAAMPAAAPPTAATVDAEAKEPRQKKLESQCDEEASQQAPNDVAQVLGEMLELSDVLFDGMEDQSKNVFAAIDNMPAGGNKPETLMPLLDQVMESLHQLRTLCDRNIERLSAARSDMNTMPEPKRPASGGKSRKGASKAAPSKMLAG